MYIMTAAPDAVVLVSRRSLNYEIKYCPNIISDCISH